jgi:hypothetical protein
MMCEWKSIHREHWEEIPVFRILGFHSHLRLNVLKHIGLICLLKMTTRRIFYLLFKKKVTSWRVEMHAGISQQGLKHCPHGPCASGSTMPASVCFPVALFPGRKEPGKKAGRWLMPGGCPTHWHLEKNPMAACVVTFRVCPNGSRVAPEMDQREVPI